MANQPEFHSLVSSTVEDWQREKKKFFSWDPGRALLSAMRDWQSHQNNHMPHRILMRKIAALRHRFWSVISGADIPINCKIGGGLLIPHPNGIVIHPDVIIGPNCLILQQVTIGVGSKVGLAIIEGHVDIGAGAKILGGIRLGEHSKVGANAVVLNDVPAGSTVVGIPARVL